MVVALVLLGFGASGCGGDDGSTVTGRGLDEAGRPNVGITVAQGGGTTTTDSSGRFRFANVAPGEYLYVASAEACKVLDFVTVSKANVTKLEPSTLPCSP